MNLRFLAAVVIALRPLAAADGKPPPRGKADARPSPSPPHGADSGTPSLLRWLLLQDGGPDAAAVAWPEVVLAAGGKQLSPLEPANAPDAALLAKLGTALDAILPRLNRPDSSLRAASPLTTAEIAARVADELHTTMPAAPVSTDAACPVLRWNDNPAGRTCYLVVIPYPTGGKDGAVRVLTMRAADLAGQFTTEGVCLAVGIEHNGKTGHDLALLNWEAIDLARLSLRCSVSFETNASGLHVLGATLADGRRGRD